MYIITLMHTFIILYAQSIEKKTAAPTVVAELNNAKNRYKNIFPCELIVGCVQGSTVKHVLRYHSLNRYWW